MLEYRIWSVKYKQYINHGEFFIIGDGHLYEVDRSDLYVKVDESNYIIEYGMGSLFVGDIVKDSVSEKIYSIMFGEHYININGGEYTVESVGFYLNDSDYYIDGARPINLETLTVIGNIHTR